MKLTYYYTQLEAVVGKMELNLSLKTTKGYQTDQNNYRDFISFYPGQHKN